MPDKIKLGPDWNSRVRDRVAIQAQADMELRQDLILTIEATLAVVVKLPYDIRTDSGPRTLEEAQQTIGRMPINLIVELLMQLVQLREA